MVLPQYMTATRGAISLDLYQELMRSLAKFRYALSEREKRSLQGTSKEWRLRETKEESNHQDTNEIVCGGGAK
jgi:hypothetical protein